MIGTVDPSKEITESRPVLLLYRSIWKKKYQDLQQKGFADQNPLSKSKVVSFMLSELDEYQGDVGSCEPEVADVPE